MPLPSSALLNDVRDALMRARLGPHDSLVVGFSGGVDSQSLTHALVTLRDRGEGPTVLAVHVDHQLRPESAENARDCQQVADRMGVPFEIAQVDVTVWERGRGVEAAARQARYGALASAALRSGSSWLALGHTLDDQAETVLLRLARGTSLDGLTGMREISDRSVPFSPSGQVRATVHVLRPLLSRRRSEIESYASQHHLVPIIDPSNADIRFSRNAVRHQVLPLLEHIVPAAVKSIARSSRLIADDAGFLSALASKVFDDASLRLGPCIQLDRNALRDVAVPLQRRVMVMAVHALQDQIDLSSERVDALRQAALSGSVSSIIEVGHGIAALVDYERLVLGPSAAIESTLREHSELPLLDPDTVIPVELSRHIELEGGWMLDIQLGRSPSGWELRTRRTGDRLVMEGGPAIKLQDWLVNQKVPGYLRDHVPLLIHDGLVRWIVGHPTQQFKDVDSELVARLRKWTVDVL